MQTTSALSRKLSPVTNQPDRAKEIVFKLDHEARQVGLQINVSKTKLMTFPQRKEIKLNGANIENVDEFIYLEHKLVAKDGNETAKIKRRM